MTQRSRLSAIARPIAGTFLALGLTASVGFTLQACSKSSEEETNAVSGSARLEGEYSFPESSSLEGIYFKDSRYLLVTREGERSVGSFTFDDRVLRLVDATTDDVIEIRVDRSTLKRMSSTTPKSGTLGIRRFGGGDGPIELAEGDNGCQSEAFSSEVPGSGDGTTGVANFVGGEGEGAIVSGEGEAIVSDDGGGPLVDPSAAGLLCSTAVAAADAGAAGSTVTNLCCGVATLLANAVVQSAGRGGADGSSGASTPVRTGERLGDMVQGGRDGGSICTGGTCDLSDVTPGTPCTDDRTCTRGAKGTGVICSTSGPTKGRCVEGCNTPDDCPGGSACDKSSGRGVCASASVPRLGTPCTPGDNSQCNGGKTGAGRVCSAGSKTCIVGCHSDADCSAGTKCDKSARPAWVCSDATRSEAPANPNYIWPMALAGNSSCGGVCEFGRRPSGAHHAGIDVGGWGQGSNADDVWAAQDGVVDYAGWGSGYGNMVDILHADGIMTRYAHLASMRVKAGDRVKQKQVIGIRGNTGGNYEIHLHFEMRPNSRPGAPGTAVNPRTLLPQPGLVRAR
jgi:hypothetical protein